jgi:hypothetical protein
VTSGTCSATGPGMSKKARRVRPAGLKIAARQTDPAGECPFKPANLGPNARPTRAAGGAETILRVTSPGRPRSKLREPEPSSTSCPRARGQRLATVACLDSQCPRPCSQMLRGFTPPFRRLASPPTPAPRLASGPWRAPEITSHFGFGNLGVCDPLSARQAVT